MIRLRFTKLRRWIRRTVVESVYEMCYNSIFPDAEQIKVLDQ
jgi:hypothetical protein